jgi:hypothetical protein
MIRGSATMRMPQGGVELAVGAVVCCCRSKGVVITLLLFCCSRSVKPVVKQRNSARQVLELTVQRTP